MPLYKLFKTSFKYTTRNQHNTMWVCLISVSLKHLSMYDRSTISQSHHSPFLYSIADPGLRKHCIALFRNPKESCNVCTALWLPGTLIWAEISKNVATWGFLSLFQPYISDFWQADSNLKCSFHVAHLSPFSWVKKKICPKSQWTTWSPFK